MEHGHLSLKCLQVPKQTFFIFMPLPCTLNEALKFTEEPMYSPLNLSQVISYMTFTLLQQRSPLAKYLLPVTKDVNFTSATK